MTLRRKAKLTIALLLSMTALVGCTAESGNSCNIAMKHKQYLQATTACSSLARQSNAEAQFQLGHLYELGLAVELNYSEAIRWYSSAANQGHADAQNNLGWMHLFGLGVEKSYDEAAKWFELAAGNGNREAVKNLTIARNISGAVLLSDNRQGPLRKLWSIINAERTTGERSPS